MKVNFGIYIGTSSASIAKMEEGKVRVYRSDTQKDSIPIAVCFTKKGILTGEKAFNAWKIEELKGRNTNCFIGFTRTLGSDIKFSSSNANRSFSSEELLAEVIKSLRSFVEDENVEAAVITVPAAFEMNQINEEAPFRQKENLIIDYFNQTSTNKFSEFQSQSKRE